MTIAESDQLFTQATHIARIQRAHAYAAQVRERNTQDCQCEACIRERLLPAVMQMTQNWPAAQAARTK